MTAAPPPKTTATKTISPADCLVAARMPMSAATNATKTSPSRNIVTVIRAVRPRSGAYRVRVDMTYLRIPPGLDPGRFCPGPPGPSVSSYLNNARDRLKASTQAAESDRDHCAHGEAAAGAGNPRPPRTLQASAAAYQRIGAWQTGRASRRAAENYGAVGSPWI